MKEILAVIRMNKMNDTKRALAEAGIASFTARKVIGRGLGRVEYHLVGGGEDAGIALDQLGPGPRMIPKRMITLVLPDEKAEDAVQAIIGANQTGHAGDGKIFVMPVSDAVRVRTGETGAAALDESPN